MSDIDSTTQVENVPIDVTPSKGMPTNPMPGRLSGPFAPGSASSSNGQQTDLPTSFRGIIPLSQGVSTPSPRGWTRRTFGSPATNCNTRLTATTLKKFENGTATTKPYTAPEKIVSGQPPNVRDGSSREAAPPTAQPTAIRVARGTASR